MCLWALGSAGKSLSLKTLNAWWRGKDCMEGDWFNLLDQHYFTLSLCGVSCVLMLRSYLMQKHCKRPAYWDFVAPLLCCKSLPLHRAASSGIRTCPLSLSCSLHHYHAPYWRSPVILLLQLYSECATGSLITLPASATGCEYPLGRSYITYLAACNITNAESPSLSVAPLSSQSTNNNICPCLGSPTL